MNVHNDRYMIYIQAKKVIIIFLFKHSVAFTEVLFSIEGKPQIKDYVTLRWATTTAMQTLFLCF